MLVNTAWLLEYLEHPAESSQVLHERVREALPAVGLEIEAEHQLRTELSGIRIGFVRRKIPIAAAKGMYACEIEVQRGQVIPVVCASEHEIEEGWGVPIATAQTVLPTGVEIKDGHFHGVESRGMICLDGEMGLLTRGSGMHHFEDESVLGVALPELIEIPEYLLELNVLPNRPDFLGLIGIAREVAAQLNWQLRIPQTHAVRGGGAPPVSVEIRDPEACPRYMGALVRGVRVGPSPGWLKGRLLAAGMRPINNIVDVTNYVLHEFGQPLHAFDYDTLHGGRIVVRRMAPGESLKLLTGAVVSGERSPLVIADADRPVALAGIMGGAETQMTGQTINVLLEGACFDPVNIRQTVSQVDLGMSGRGTASSYRFERGTDPNRTLEAAVARALWLIRDVAGGDIVGPIADQYPKPRAPREFTMSPQRTSAYLGIPIDAATIRDRLARLEMEVGPDLRVRVPTWRVDANDPVVLIEDVARIGGYGKIPDEPKETRPTRGQRSRLDQFRQHAADFFARCGYYEARNPSLESPSVSGWLGEPGPAVRVRNAQSEEMSVLRRSLLPGLIKTADTNLRRGLDHIRFFEIDRAFDPTGVAKSQEAAITSDRWRIGAIAGGQASRSEWRSAAAKQVDLYTFKGVAEDFLEAARCRGATFSPTDTPPFLAGMAAEVRIGQRVIGHLGQIATNVVGLDKLSFPLFGLEFDLALLLETSDDSRQYRAFSRFPAVVRDLAIVVSTDVAFADLEAVIRNHAGETLESLSFSDLYRGSQVPAGRQSLALRLTFRDPAKSLTAEEVSANIDRIVDGLRTRFDSSLRT